MNFVGHWSRCTGLAQLTLLLWLGIVPGKYFDWKKRYGRANAHYGLWVPEDLAPGSRSRWVEAVSFLWWMWRVR